MSFTVSPKSAPDQSQLPTARVESPVQRAIAAWKAAEAATQQPAVSAEPIVEEAVQGQPDTSEATPAASPEATQTKESPLSKQYAILARKEKALRAEMQKLNAEREAFKAEKASLTSPSKAEDLSKYISKDDLKNNALGVLNELGVTYDQLVNQAVNQPSAEEIALKRLEASIDAKLKKLEESQSSTQKSLEQAEAQRVEQVRKQLSTETRKLIQADPSFETIKATNSVSDVVDLIEKTFSEEGYLMSVEEAATAVEEYLVDEALKLSRLQKIQAKLKQSAPAQETTKPTSAPGSVKTLTNSMASTKPLSAKERAILAFKGELKQ